MICSRLTRLIIPCALLGAACAAPAQPPPAFERAGVIEGFYGPPWSHQDRLDMLRFMGRVGLTVYIYAPKDDPYHRSRWREPYPDAAAERIRQLARTADETGVEFWYAISPGLTMTYSDSGDYDDLLRKIDQVSALGVRHFGLFVDDVPAELTSEADRRAYGTLAAAHVALANRLYRELSGRGHTLAFTPTTYTNAWGDPEYVAAIGAGLAPEIMVVWTGPDVASPTISAAQAAEWGRLLRRRPLLWDNYPVNDYARWRLFLGPFTGRAPDLAGATLGIIANPMNEAHASMLPLATLADYARNPAGYDPEQSLAAAAEMLYGIHRDALQPFLDAFGDYGWDHNVFEPLYILEDTIPLAPIENALSRLSAALDDLQSLDTLRGELEPFVAGNRERLEALRRSPAYAVRNGQLIHRDDLDRMAVAPVPAGVVIDGSLREWPAESWRPLYLAPGRAADARVALGRDTALLYMALDVRTDHVRVLDGNRLGEGDHIALVVDGDPTDETMGSDDLVVLLPPPNDVRGVEPVITSLPFRGFMAKWSADNRAFTFSEFHLSTFGTAPSPLMAPMAAGVRYAARPSPTGYTAEVALPHLGRRELRVSLTVTTTAGGRRVVSLSQLNYAANPATYAELVLRGES
jgi:hypothetical protein